MAPQSDDLSAIQCGAWVFPLQPSGVEGEVGGENVFKEYKRTRRKAGVFVLFLEQRGRRKPKAWDLRTLIPPDSEDRNGRNCIKITHFGFCASDSFCISLQ
ncbi:hypothetical protein HPP92_020009 [Vanilla planifolia]|uniref:Uncharacterized protein n=1 Tax=Vanilla planifolia TaxID=51239 RepID=A0A835Q0I4_VANPL|nr:hypothetical protein HPP92_020009 [Vanilla planifolia]